MREENADQQASREPKRTRSRQEQRYLIIGVSVVVLFLLLIVVAVWKWRRSSATDEEAVSPVVSVRGPGRKQKKLPRRCPPSARSSARTGDGCGQGQRANQDHGAVENKLVKAGEVIAVFESRDLVAQRNEAVAALNQERANERSVTTGAIPQANEQDQRAVHDAQAKVRTARATFQRRQALFAKGGISKKDLEASELELTTAEDELRLDEQTIVLRNRSLNPNDAALAAAKVAAAQQHLATLDAQLSYTVIRAPISGLITDQFQYEGEFAAAGGKLFNIADMSQVIVKAPFSDTVAAQLKVGDVATVLPTDTSAEAMRGQISLLSRSSDPTNRTVEVWVALGNEGSRLRANGAAQITPQRWRKVMRSLCPLLPSRWKQAMGMREP